VRVDSPNVFGALKQSNKLVDTWDIIRELDAVKPQQQADAFGWKIIAACYFTVSPNYWKCFENFEGKNLLSYPLVTGLVRYLQ